MGFIVGVVLLGVLVAAGVWWARMSKSAEARRKQEMRDLVTGKIGRTARADPAEAPVSAPIAAPVPPPARPVRPQAFDPDKAERLRHENIGRPEPAPPMAPPVQPAARGLPRELTLAELQRAQKIYQQALADAEASNKGPVSRPTDSCWLQISYVDADGVWTSRNVAPYRSGNTNEKFDAWCETKGARRTFFFSRVQSGVDSRTGRHLSRQDVFQLIHPERKVPASLA